ncbi:hypothetical protein Nepgr_022188 [Nepenthes gracilis]|uniref:Uncharacterized protein n=1 Tax=Nepenthes gracilis TaxID=150966 RepID=A0AAD3T0F9_NEPGR|nr:hypothetical protein Nepgr_022188 [Nepenthes gracilis]
MASVSQQFIDLRNQIHLRLFTAFIVFPSHIPSMPYTIASSSVCLDTASPFSPLPWHSLEDQPSDVHVSTPHVRGYFDNKSDVSTNGSCRNRESKRRSLNESSGEKRISFQSSPVIDGLESFRTTTRYKFFQSYNKDSPY